MGLSVVELDGKWIQKQYTCNKSFHLLKFGKSIAP